MNVSDGVKPEEQLLQMKKTNDDGFEKQVSPSNMWNCMCAFECLCQESMQLKQEKI